MSACISLLFQPSSPRLIGSWEQSSLNYLQYTNAKLINYPRRVHEAKYLPPTKVTYTHTGFQMAKLASYFNMKVQCHVFAEP